MPDEAGKEWFAEQLRQNRDPSVVLAEWRERERAAAVAEAESIVELPHSDWAGLLPKDWDYEPAGHLDDTEDAFHDVVMLPPEVVYNRDGKYYRVCSECGGPVYSERT